MEIFHILYIICIYIYIKLFKFTIWDAPPSTFFQFQIPHLTGEGLRFQQDLPLDTDPEADLDADPAMERARIPEYIAR